MSDKDELLRALDRSIIADTKRKSAGQEIVENAAEGEAIAKATRTIVSSWAEDSCVPSDQLVRLTKAWTMRADQAERSLGQVRIASLEQPSTATASLTTTMTPTVLSAWVGPEAKAASEELRSILFRPSLFEEVRTLLIGFGLQHTQPGFRSSLDSLELAHVALRRPGMQAPNPSAVLIGARESLDRALADLAQRVPQQTRTGSAAARVALIGSQCAKDGYSAGHFDFLASTVTELRRDLSSRGKQQKSDPAETSRLFDSTL